MSKTRHSIDTWTAAGLIALRTEGPNALRAEPLARALKTTKGSFYWHFKDVPAFHSAVIEAWKTQAFGTVITHLSAEGAPQDRLRAFGADVMKDASDRAMRQWSTPLTAAAIAQVDEQRLTFISTLLRQMGLSNPGFAQASYGALIGLPSLSNTTPDASFEALIDLVLALK